MKLLCKTLINQGSLSSTLPLNKSDAIEGTKVKDKSNEPRIAIMKVDAIGMNILPSTPTNANTGRNDNATINSPKPADFLI